MTERVAFNHAGAARLPAPRRPRRAAEEAISQAVLVLVEARRDWAYLGLLAFTLLLFFRPQEAFPALGWLHPTELVAVGALGAMVTNRLSRNVGISRITPEVTGLIALGGVIVVTAPFGVWPGGSIAVLTDLFAKVFLIFILMVNTITSPRRLEQFTWILVISSGYVALGSVLNYIHGENLLRGSRVQGAVGGMFGNPNDLALNMVSFLPLPIFIVLSRARTIWRMVAAGVMLLMFAAAFFTLSRSGFLGLVSMLLVVAFFGRQMRPGMLAVGLVGLLLASPMLPPSFWGRMSSIVEPEKDDNGAREARKIVMREAWNTFLDHPFTGVGAGQFKNYNPPGREETSKVTHNVLLQVGAELGVIGLGVFLFLIGRVAVSAAATRRMAKRSTGRRAPPSSAGAGAADPFRPEERELLMRHGAAIAASLAGWFVCAMFASVAFNWTFYYLLGLAVAGRELTRDRIDSVRKGDRVIPV